MPTSGPAAPSSPAPPSAAPSSADTGPGRARARIRRRLAGCSGNLVLLAVSAGLALGVAEAAVRYLGGDKFHPLVPSGERGLFWEYDPVLGWKHRPGQTGRFRKPGSFDTSVTINSAGFRGPEHAPEPSPGIERIVVLGDSVSWGYGVEDAEVFTERLAARRPGTEVVNLAVSGYGTDQQSLLLERDGMTWHPALVLQQVCANDFRDVTQELVHGIYPKPRFHFSAGELVAPTGAVPSAPVLDRGLFWLETRSWLWRLVNLSKPGASAVGAVRRAAWQAGLSKSSAPEPPPGLGERLVVALLARSNGIARGGGARFAVFLAPPMPATAREAVEEFGRREGVMVFDLAVPFAQAARSGGREPLFLPNDLHWTREGHEVAAAALADWLDRTYH